MRFVQTQQKKETSGLLPASYLKSNQGGFGEIGKHFPLKMEWNYILKSSSLLIRKRASKIV